MMELMISNKEWKKKKSPSCLMNKGLKERIEGGGVVRASHELIFSF